jgi:hypothetical protein
MLGSITILFAMGLARNHLEPRLAWSFFVVGIVAIAWINWRLYRTACPNCAKPIGAIGFRTPTGVPDGANKCPHCSIRLDSEMPRAGR